MNKILALCLLLLPLLAGCASPPAYDNNYDSVILKPGDSRICVGSPCEVHFAMPRGKGKLNLTGKGQFSAAYPAGKTVYLGRFGPGSYSFKVEGKGYPASYLHVGGREEG